MGVLIHVLAVGYPLFLWWLGTEIAASGQLIPPLWLQWLPAAVLVLCGWLPALRGQLQ